jgi:hypothetical protein
MTSAQRRAPRHPSATGHEQIGESRYFLNVKKVLVKLPIMSSSVMLTPLVVSVRTMPVYLTFDRRDA